MLLLIKDKVYKLLICSYSMSISECIHTNSTKEVSLYIMPEHLKNYEGGAIFRFTNGIELAAFPDFKSNPGRALKLPDGTPLASIEDRVMANVDFGLYRNNVLQTAMSVDYIFDDIKGNSERHVIHHNTGSMDLELTNAYIAAALSGPFRTVSAVSIQNPVVDPFTKKVYAALRGYMLALFFMKTEVFQWKGQDVFRDPKG